MTARPVVIVGMHRSGTSMLAQLLEAEGLFLGSRLQPGHGEATYFQDLNEYALTEAAASWDRPEGITTLFDRQKPFDYLVDYLRTSMSGPRTLEFLGLRRWVRHRSLLGLDEPWGWKDPRTTLLFPLWRQVFPECRVIHVTRHGVDVARSLQSRYERGIDEYIHRYHETRSRYRFIPRRRNFSVGIRFADLDAGIELWDEYVTAAEATVDALGDDAISFRYEDLLADPDPIMRRLVDFCGLDSPAERTWTDRVRPERAYAHRADPELVAAAERHRELLAGHGYGDR